MTTDEFVKKLGNIAPSIKKLISQGYSEEDARECRNSFFLRKKPPKTPALDDPLIHLICNYETTKLEFRGGVILGEKEVCFTPGRDKILVGVIEVDPLVIDRNTGAVELLDHAQPDFVMAKCAESGSQFLEALFKVASFEPPYLDLDMTDEITEAQAIANDEAAHRCAMECAKVAGVPAEGSIYQTLLGCDCWII